jgi:hypothetical protein
MSPLRKYSNYDNQPFFTLHPKGKQLIINLVESSSFLFSCQMVFRENSNLTAKCKRM